MTIKLHTQQVLAIYIIGIHFWGEKKSKYLRVSSLTSVFFCKSVIMALLWVAKGNIFKYVRELNAMRIDSVTQYLNKQQTCDWLFF